LPQERLKSRSPILFFLAIILAFKSYSQQFDQLENSVYIYNFIKYTSWPEKKHEIRIGIIGNTPLETELRNLLAKKTNSAVSYELRKIAISDARNVDVIVVARTSSQQVKELVRITMGSPILIITEKENMGPSGACISFFIDEDNNFKTGYQLSIRNCTARKLLVNEQLRENAVLMR